MKKYNKKIYKYHYTYILQHKTEDKRYIGVRSCNVLPTEDITYWGSSKYIPTDVQDTHCKIILKVFKNRQEALKHEMLLHVLNNVSKSDAYYNKAMQTSTKFDTTGTILTEEHKRKCSAALTGKKHTEKTKEKIRSKNLGRPFSEEHKKNLSKSLKSSPKLKTINNPNFKPWFMTDFGKNITYLYYDISMNEKSVKEGRKEQFYRGMVYQFKRTGKPITRGEFKNCMFGLIPNS